MRAVTREEIERIAGGLRHIYTKTGLRPESSGTCPNGNCPPVTVTPPSSGGGSPSGGGGGGPVRVAPPPSGGGGHGGPPGYNDGTHDIFARNYTGNSLDDGRNNPGDVGYTKFTISHGATGEKGGLAEFSSENAGRDAMGAVIDAFYGGDTISNFESHGYTATDPEEAEAGVEDYMSRSGYGSSTWQQSISSMSNAEFNVFLDAITYQEGHTNMNGQNKG
jgi:hypothetical protein